MISYECKSEIISFIRDNVEPKHNGLKVGSIKFKTGSYGVLHQEEDSTIITLEIQEID